MEEYKVVVEQRHHPWPRGSQVPRTKRPVSPPFMDLERMGLYIPEGSVRGVMLSGEFWQTTKTDNYTAGDEMVILVDATSGDKTITLPLASTSPGKVYYIKKIDTTSHKVTIQPNAVDEKIDNETNYEIVVPYTCITPNCDGNNWWII